MSLRPLIVFGIAGLTGGCAPLSPPFSAQGPFPLQGESVAVEVDLRGGVSPMVRAGEILWGSQGYLPGGKRYWVDDDGLRARQSAERLAGRLRGQGVTVSGFGSVLSRDPTVAGAEKKAVLTAYYDVAERERWVRGRDRKGRRASMIAVERCAVVLGEGRWFAPGETVRFPIRVEWCDSAIGELRSDAYFRISSWNRLLDITIDRAEQQWEEGLRRSLAGRGTPIGEQP